MRFPKAYECQFDLHYLCDVPSCGCKCHSANAVIQKKKELEK